MKKLFKGLLVLIFACVSFCMTGCDNPDLANLPRFKEVSTGRYYYNGCYYQHKPDFRDWYCLTGERKTVASYRDMLLTLRPVEVAIQDTEENILAGFYGNYYYIKEGIADIPDNNLECKLSALTIKKTAGHYVFFTTLYERSYPEKNIEGIICDSITFKDLVYEEVETLHRDEVEERDILCGTVVNHPYFIAYVQILESSDNTLYLCEHVRAEYDEYYKIKEEYAPIIRVTMDELSTQE